MIPVLGIPHFNRPDLTLRLLHSIDYPVKQVVLIDQSETPENALDEERFADAFGDEVWILRHPNAGVAGAWNEIIKLFPAKWWLIANNDIAFAPGDLAGMAVALNHCVTTPTENPACMVCGNHGASWFAITDECVARVGLFDENIYPAYLEDCDYRYRCKLLGVPWVTLPGTRSVHGTEDLSGSCTIYSDPAIREKNHRTHGRNFEYYRAKWGGNNGQETFKTPFNDPNWPVWAWKFDPAMRAEQQW
jgi:GT2 family glycosyltransferase